MPCRPFRLPGGVSGFICGRTPQRPRIRCHFCSSPATHFCDYPDPNHTKTGTCDRALCDQHAVRVSPNKDHCPDHPKA